MISLPLGWQYVMLGGLGHSLHTAVVGCLGFIAGGPLWAVGMALGYYFREIRQHEKTGTRGAFEWTKRVLDAILPIVTAFLFIHFMGGVG